MMMTNSRAGLDGDLLSFSKRTASNNMLSVSRQTTDKSDYSCGSVESHESEYQFDDATVAVARQESDTVLDAEGLALEQQAEITRVAELFDLPRTTVSILLGKAAWNSERLIERYMEDPAKVLLEAGVNEFPEAERGASAAADTITCQVCFCESPFSETSAARCNHRFCNDCWDGFLTSQISDGATTEIACMAPKCDVPLEAPFVQALVAPSVFTKYSRFAQAAFVGVLRAFKLRTYAPRRLYSCDGHTRPVSDYPPCDVQMTIRTSSGAQQRGVDARSRSRAWARAKCAAASLRCDAPPHSHTARI